jgi:DNA-binding transcriptional regulator PaaX
VEARERQEVKSEEVVDCIREHGGEVSNEDLLVALMNRLRLGDRACREGIYRARDEGKILAGKGEGRGNKRTWKLPEELASDTSPN